MTRPPARDPRRLLGFAGDPRPGGRAAAVTDIAAAVVSVLLVTVVVTLLSLPGWLGPLFGGCVAVLTLQNRWGSRLYAARRRDPNP
ncbi:hypothetical protein [Streptomyces sp. NPDC057702]|uniref:hypothetical protein n=1 Tax=unclassified Streptomyces TaxID=2593676 RepID=UPI0036BC4BF0